MRPTWLPAGATVLALWELAWGLRLSRFLLQELMQWLVRLDLAAVQIVRRVFVPRYELLGACQRRGACCTHIVALPPRAVRSRPRLLSAFVGFHRLVHNFHVSARGPGGELVFRCGFLQTDNKCGIYRYRPRLCRNYPLLPFFAAPQILPGCGYRVKRRGMGAHARLPVIDAHVAVHHPTPPTRVHDGSLEYAEDFRLVDVSPRGNEKENRSR